MLHCQPLTQVTEPEREETMAHPVEDGHGLPPGSGDVGAMRMPLLFGSNDRHAEAQPHQRRADGGFADAQVPHQARPSVLHTSPPNVVIDTLLAQNEDMASVHIELAVDDIFSAI